MSPIILYCDLNVPDELILTQMNETTAILDFPAISNTSMVVYKSLHASLHTELKHAILVSVELKHDTAVFYSKTWSKLSMSSQVCIAAHTSFLRRFGIWTRKPLPRRRSSNDPVMMTCVCAQTIERTALKKATSHLILSSPKTLINVFVCASEGMSL